MPDHRKLTPNRAADIVRSEILRKMDQLESANNNDTYFEMWGKLRRFISGMAKRASSKKGGLGRK